MRAAAPLAGPAASFCAAPWGETATRRRRRLRPERLRADARDVCVVCLTQPRAGDLAVVCERRHAVHAACARGMLASGHERCPTCRKPLAR